MNTQTVKGDLKDLKGNLKQTWSKLTDDDMTYLDGGVDQIVGRIQKAYGLTKERASEEFDKFKAKAENSKYFRDDRGTSMEEYMGSATQMNGLNSDRIKSHANSAVSQASGMIENEILDPANEYLKKARDIAGQAANRTTDLVKQYPGYTVLGAAAIGFLTAAYVFRRK